MTEKQGIKDLTERPFLKKIIFYIIPIIFTGILQSLYNAADLVIVGSYRGAGALAAVGTTGSLTNLIVGLFMGLSVGAGVVVANHIGALEYKKVSRVVHSAVLMSAILGVVVGIVGFIFARNFLSMMDVVDSPEYDTLTKATLYLKIIFCGVPASMVYNYCTAIVNATGETKKPLIFLAISGFVNLLLNILLVALCGMGVEGVAIGTIASQYLSAALILIYMMRVDSPIKFSFKKLCLDKASIKRMLVIGIPSGLQSTLFSFSNVLIQSSVNGFGDLVMAGNAAASNLEGFSYIAMNAVYRASLNFTGQNVGAKKYKNIKIITIQTVICASVIGLVCAAIILLFRNALVGLYISDEGITAEAFKITWDAAMKRLFYILPLYFLCGVMEALCGVLRGMGKSISAMVFSLVGACAFRIIWIETVFKFISPEINTVYLSYPISWLLVIIMDLIYLIYSYRKIVRQTPTDALFNKIKRHSYKS